MKTNNLEEDLEKIGTNIYSGQLPKGIYGVLHDPDKLKTYILNREKALLSQNYVKGYEDCLEEKYDKAKKHFDKKLAQTRKEVIEEFVRKIRGMKKEYDDDVIQRSYDIEHNEALDKVIQKAKELK